MKYSLSIFSMMYVLAVATPTLVVDHQLGKLLAVYQDDLALNPIHEVTSISRED